METKYDCIVLGAGIAGLGAALTLNDAGLNVLVIEKESRVGGRMTTDRENGFIMDRGVTLLSGQYHNMKAIVKRFGLQKHVHPIDFLFGHVQDGKHLRLRGGRIDDVLFRSNLSLSARMALLRFAAKVFINRNRLAHGHSSSQCEFDNETVNQYFMRLGGTELQKHIFSPGMVAACGGYLDISSKLILMQIFRNLVMGGTWTIDQGVDLIPETIASQLDVKYNREVNVVDYGHDGVMVRTGHGELFRARSVIFAMPGRLVPALCPGLPGATISSLANTRFARMRSVYVGMDQITPEKYLAVGEATGNYIIELEHNRCRHLCPPGKSLATVFWWDNDRSQPTLMNEMQLRQETERVLQTCLPSTRTCNRNFTHIVNWENGIPYFPKGRLTEMSELRKEMKTWSLPLQLCGDYLDGISSESALQTGIEAGNNTINYLNRIKHGVQKSKTTVH